MDFLKWHEAPFNTSDISNIGGRWLKWIDRFENFLEASDITDAKRKKALLLHLAGDEVFSIFQSLPDPPPIENVTENDEDSEDDEQQNGNNAAVDEVDEYERAKVKLKNHFVPRTNVNFEIFNFRQCKQHTGESIDQFYARLLKLATNCNFSNKDDEIKSQVILTTTSTQLRRHGLRANPSLSGLLQYGQTLETTEQHINVIEQAPGEHSVSFNRQPNRRHNLKNINKENSNNSNNFNNNQRDNRNSNNKNNNNSNNNQKCRNCGNNWHPNGRENCPARNFSCNRCGKQGHFAKVCMSNSNNNNINNNGSNKNNQSETRRSVNNVDSNNRSCNSNQYQQDTNFTTTNNMKNNNMRNNNTQSKNVQNNGRQNNNNNNHMHLQNINVSGNQRYQMNYDDSDSEYSTFNVGNTNSTLPTTNVFVNGTQISFTIDTGSSANIISKNVFDKFLNTTVLTSAASDKIFPYNSTMKLPVVGKFKAVLKHGANETQTNVFVIDSEAQSLLGYQTSISLGIVKMIFQVESEITSKYVEHRYPEIVHGVGKLKDHQVHLHIDPNVQPTAQKHRRVPFHVRSKVERELDRLRNEDVIEEAVGPTPWVSPIVIIPKPLNKDEIRMCVDMRIANTAIKRERHITPTIDDIFHMLNGCVLFSKIDLRNGYHQLELDEESRIITTFSTHVGLFRYKRLSFGVNAAAEIFQDVIRQTLANIPGVLNISDDILIAGKSKQEHDKSLLMVLDRLKENHLTINGSKCMFSQNRITFFGYVFSNTGIYADPRKLNVLQQIEPPNNQSEIRSLLGMLNYVSKFLRNLASNTKILRDLTLKDAQWNWTTEHQKTFEFLKNQLTNADHLAYFDVNKETHIHVDAGPYGLGAILSQQTTNNNVEIIAYGSRSLTSTEQRYSQIEREMLAISWALQHFHLYLFGTHFVLHTDHKPLVNILTNPRSLSNARIERMCLKIQQYSYTIKHQKGVENPADYLSRYPVQHNDDKIGKKVEAYVNFICTSSLPKAVSLEEVQQATKLDATLQHVIESIQNNKEIKMPIFQRIRNELSIVEGVILRQKQIVLPATLHQRAISLAHKGHLGIVKTKQLLRSRIWFPSLDKMVEQIVKSCPICQIATDTYDRDPIIIRKPASKPFETVNVDYAGPFPNGKYVFIMVDECSRYPFFEIVSSTKYSNIEPVLSKNFAQYGVPQCLISDNGPPFNGAEFAEMSLRYNFKHHRTTPYWPEANGRAERSVKTLKKTLICSNLETGNFASQLNEFLMNYRATPHSSTGRPPYEVMFGRRIKTHFPEFCSEPSVCDRQLQQRDLHSRIKYKTYADIKRHTSTRFFNVGDKVLCKQPKVNKLTPPFNPVPCVIEKVDGRKITARRNGQIIVRNSSFFKHFHSPPVFPTSHNLNSPYHSQIPIKTQDQFGDVMAESPVVTDGASSKVIRQPVATSIDNPQVEEATVVDIGPTGISTNSPVTSGAPSVQMQPSTPRSCRLPSSDSAKSPRPIRQRRLPAKYRPYKLFGTQGGM